MELSRLSRVARGELQDVEGSLWAFRATAQQINARQKVELSIRWVRFLHDNYGLNYDSSKLLRYTVTLPNHNLVLNYSSVKTE